MCATRKERKRKLYDFKIDKNGGLSHMAGLTQLKFNSEAIRQSEEYA